MKLVRLTLRLRGWQFIEPVIYSRQSVICVAPHTNNMDLIWGKLYYWAVGQRAHFLMKHELFAPPLGRLFKAMDGIPIGCRHKGNTVEQAVVRLRAKGDFAVAITSEGSRKARDRWRIGLCHIAEEAGVPIQLAVIDYKRKKLDIFERFVPTGDPDKDIHYMRSRYRADQAEKPELFSEQVQ